MYIEEFNNQVQLPIVQYEDDTRKLQTSKRT